MNIVDCAQCLIFPCSIQASGFTISYSFDYCDNCIYENDPSENVLVYNRYDITTRQSIRYFDFKDWKNEEILIEYNWLVA